MDMASTSKHGKRRLARDIMSVSHTAKRVAEQLISSNNDDDDGFMVAQKDNGTKHGTRNGTKHGTRNGTKHGTRNGTKHGPRNGIKHETKHGSIICTEF